MRADGPGAETACPQPHEHRADEFAERGGVDWIQLLLVAVTQVVVIEGAAGQTHSFRRLIVIQQPLQLHTTCTSRQMSET